MDPDREDPVGQWFSGSQLHIWPGYRNGRRDRPSDRVERMEKRYVVFRRDRGDRNDRVVCIV